MLESSAAQQLRTTVCTNTQNTQTHTKGAQAHGPEDAVGSAVWYSSKLHGVKEKHCPSLVLSVYDPASQLPHSRSVLAVGCLDTYWPGLHTVRKSHTPCDAQYTEPSHSSNTGKRWGWQTGGGKTGWTRVSLCACACVCACVCVCVCVELY